jgi:DNA-binding NtrC family response regulator
MAAQIIIAEDEAPLRLLLGEMLVQDGLKVLDAADGVAALELVRENPSVTLLLTDVKMPRMDGYALVDAALALRPELKVLVMTGFAQDHPPSAALRAREFRVLVKPFDMGRLSALVGDMMSRP